MTKIVPQATDRAARVVDSINRLRKDAGITVEQLSNLTGISKRTLDRKLTSGSSTLTLGELILISDALNVPIWESIESAA